jgi:hypothetical protein
MSRWVVGLFLISAAALLFEFVPLQRKVWDGRFDLDVEIDSAEPEAIREVVGEAFGRRDIAESTAEVARRGGPIDPGDWSASARRPLPGYKLVVPVALSGRDSPFGRELSRMQYKYLVVVADMRDGTRIVKLTEIPDCRESQAVSLAFP